MIFHKTERPDPAWLPSISTRKAVLWLAASMGDTLHNSQGQACSLLARPWHSIYLDGFNPSELLRSAADAASLAPLTLRVVDGDPDEVTLAANRIPVYMTPCGDLADPRALLARLKMFQRIPTAATLFAVIADPAVDLPSLQQALQIAGAVREVVVVCESAPAGELAANRAVHWEGSLAGLERLAAGIAPPIDALRRGSTILLMTDEGTATVDLSGAVDPSYPILDRFAFVPAEAVLAEVAPSEDLVRQLLTSPVASWAPYAAGIPFARTESFLRDLRRLFKPFRERGADASCTAWIAAEQASGATTALRSVLFDLAREGYPVLIARPDCASFDFQQIATFLRSSAASVEETRGRTGHIPWIIAFDADHSLRSDDFVGGLANGLRKLNHAVIVLAVHPIVPTAGETRLRATGPSHVLGVPLSNKLDQDAILHFGTHINQFLLEHQRRRPDEWITFARESEQLTGEGKQSLFWLALRFWLLRLPGSDEPLRHWLAAKLRSTVANSDACLLALLQVAAFSRHRLALPARLLMQTERDALAPVVNEPSQPLGLRELWVGRRGAFAFAHPLIAEEVLRICAGDAEMLSRSGVSQCAGLLDLELSIFETLIGREAAGYPEVVPVIEELAVTALRVDPREAPGNYLARERIVLLLEKAPDSVFDGSQVFLHHLAKARRHVASDPPTSSYWSNPATVREQLELAASHLQEALQAAVPTDVERQENPLNLHVSLALTYDVRSRFECEQGDLAASSHFAVLSQNEYQRAQGFDPDNTYVLENYARFKLRQAREQRDETRKLALLVDAISLLEWELVVDDSKRREVAVLETLGAAFVLLDHEVGLARLEMLSKAGSEAAAVALARILATPERAGLTEVLEPDPGRAINELKSVPAAHVTWRSRLLLYQLVSAHDPLAFAGRLEVLDELASIADFPWPLQTKLEHGILLYQMGYHERGRTVYRDVRDMLPTRSSGLTIPVELKFLADPRLGFSRPLKTSLLVTNASSVGRNYYGIPTGWGNVDIPFRPYLFGRQQIRNRDDLDCLIQFTSFGPQAVPPTEA